MQVHNVECQLAQAQMNLYLAGESMDEDTVAELERHVGECDECRVTLQQKKRSLQSMLMAVGAESMSVPAGPELRIERPVKAATSSDVPAALRPKEDGPAQLKVKNWKPIILSGALALVLAGMSFLGDPTRFFGGKAAEAKPKAAAAPTEPEKKSEEPKGEHVAEKPAEPKGKATDGALVALNEAEKDPLKDIDPVPVGDSEEHAVAGYSTQVAADEASGSEPKEAAESEPPPVEKKAAPRKPKTHVAKPKAVHKAPRRVVRKGPKTRIQQAPVAKKAKGGGIKVYDATGKPVGH